VWVVIADEITRSPLHTAGKTEHELGYALRFPRALEQRFDKSADQATTVDEIKHMFEIAILKKLNRRINKLLVSSVRSCDKQRVSRPPL